MAKINVESGGTILSSGLLQLSGGAAMSSTLTAVTDQNNTASPLFLSTTVVQTKSTLRITTADNPYIDAEDNSGNNRFTIGRDPSSQQVSVDFASMPTDLTTVVGAIRTATNGSTLANIVSFTEAGLVGFGTDTPGSKIDVHSAANTVAQFNRTGTGNSQIQHLMTGTARWTTGYVNATGNYSVYDNVNAVFRINLSNTGKLTIGNGDTALTGVLNVKGSGSTSATTSLLVQNSSGTTILKTTDDQVVTVEGFGGRNTIISAGNSSGQGVITADTQSTLSITGGFQGIYLNFNNGTNSSSVARVSHNQFAPPGDNAVDCGGGSTRWKNVYSVTTNADTYSFQGTSIITGLSYAIPNTGIYFDTTNKRLNFYTNGTQVIRISETQNIGIGTTSPNASSKVDITSTTQGFLPPRMTTAQKNAIATPAAGLMVYDTTLNKLCVYTTAWETITSI